MTSSLWRIRTPTLEYPRVPASSTKPRRSGRSLRRLALARCVPSGSAVWPVTADGGMAHGGRGRAAPLWLLWSCLLAPVPLQPLDPLARTWRRMQSNPRRQVPVGTTRVLCSSTAAHAMQCSAARCGAVQLSAAVRLGLLRHRTRLDQSAAPVSRVAPRRPASGSHRYCVHLYLWYPWSTPSS